jgi:hypothetical protein
MTDAYWIHVPKAGTSFLNALLRLCPGYPRCARLKPTDTMTDFYAAYPPWHWCPETFANQSVWLDRGHTGLNQELLRRGQKGLLMVRQPEQRIISGYWQRHERGLKVPTMHSMVGPTRIRLPNGTWQYKSELDYAHSVQGCVVRMLTRPGVSCGTPPLPSVAAVSLAISRLHSHFLFVGLTEQWGRSICLLHLTLGLGACDADELLNTRPGVAAASSSGAPPPGANSSVPWHDTSPLGSFRDPFDGPVYAAAVKLFERRVRQYDASDEQCKAMACM